MRIITRPSLRSWWHPILCFQSLLSLLYRILNSLWIVVLVREFRFWLSAACPGSIWGSGLLGWIYILSRKSVLKEIYWTSLTFVSHMVSKVRKFRSLLWYPLEGGNSSEGIDSLNCLIHHLSCVPLNFFPFRSWLPVLYDSFVVCWMLLVSIYLSRHCEFAVQVIVQSKIFTCVVPIVIW